MAAGGYDGSINIDTKIDSSGFNRGVKGIGTGINGITGSLKKMAAAVGIAFGIGAIVNFGKESVKASTELSNAMVGLRSIVEGQGRSFSDAQSFLQNYISDGLIPATDAVTAYKNLAMRGYTDPQIESTLTALKNSAAFGRQASLTLGQAVSSATEGLKNENSILVDNAGVTKNVSVMWADYAASIGVGVQSLTKQQKIQAEVTGIMQETRFQTGDAAKIANTYSGEVLKLGFNFNNLKIAIGNGLIPMAQAVLPGLNAIITALTRVANLFAQVTTALFGKQATQQKAVANTASNIATSSNDAAKAQNKLADATKKAGKAADNNMATWDELNVLQQDTATSAAADQSTPDVSSGETDLAANQELGAGVTVSPAVQAAADTIKGIFADIDKALGPTKEALAGLWTEFQRLGSFSWAALLDFYNSFLVPVGKWTLGVGLPGFINALKDGMSKIDWGKINTSLHGLWEALTPFAVNVGEGLLWFWTNVLVPLGTWTINNVVPLFLDLLSGAIKVVNSVIEALEPLALWLFNNFLKPLAEWTGGVIVSVLSLIADALQKLSDWAAQNGESVRTLFINIGVAFATWKTVEFVADIQRLVGADGLGSLGTALKIIAEDRFPQVTGAFFGVGSSLKDLATNIADTVTEADGFIRTLSSSVYSSFQLTVVKMSDGIGKFTRAIGDAVASGIDFLKYLAEQAAGLVVAAARWVAATAVLVAHTVATWAQQAATAAATAATWLFNTAMTVLTSPITLVVAAIAALIAIVVLLVTHWDEVKAAGAAAWDWIKNAWSVAGNWFNTNVVQPIGKFFTNLWNGIKAAASAAWQGISGVWSVVAAWFSENVVTPIANFFGGLWEGIKTGGSVLADFMRQYVIDPIVNLFKGMYNAVVGIMEGIVNGFIGIINGFIHGINNVIDTINQIPGVNLGTIGTLRTVSIPRLATGAVIPPRAEFAAILGDQRSGTNIEAPESLIRGIVSDELSKINFQPQVNVIASGDNTGFIRWVKFEVDQENRRIGPAMATGGGR